MIEETPISCDRFRRDSLGERPTDVFTAAQVSGPVNVHLTAARPWWNHFQKASSPIVRFSSLVVQLY